MHSGDVGVIHENGQVVIIDRVKNIFKLSQGEYISPEKVENIYVQSEYLAQLLVHGDSTKDFCVVIGVVEPAKAAAFSGTAEHQESTLTDPNFIQLIMEDLYKLAQKNRLNSLEKPKQIYLTYE
jgi:long-chain acyl-CoA synthetase